MFSVPPFCATSPAEPSKALKAVPFTVIFPVLFTVVLSAIIALTEAPDADILPVFVTVPVFCANIPVELSEFAIVISAPVVKVSPEPFANIPIFPLPPVIARVFWTPPVFVGFNVTTPSFINIRVFPVPLVDFNV